MRKRIKKPMTDRAADLVIGKLRQFHAAGHNVEEVLNSSVMNCWQGVFEPKSSPVNGTLNLVTAIAGGITDKTPCCLDPSEAWASLAETWETESSSGIRRPVVGGRYLDVMAERVCRAAGIPLHRRMDWSPLVRWLKAGVETDKLVETVRRQAERSTGEIGSLRYFDNAVMAYARQVA